MLLQFDTSARENERNGNDLKEKLVNDEIPVISGRKSIGLEYAINGEYNTLNESICVSLKREFMRIWNKTQYAILPRCTASPDSNLRQWDLWGPLFFTIFLSYFLSSSKDTEEMSQTFIVVFFLMWVGGCVVTLNAILLGSKISLFQSLCVLGYCLFPILIASILYQFLGSILSFFVKLIIAAAAFAWACISSISFMGDIVGNDKKGLGMFPICLFYFAFSCYLLL